MIDLRSCQKYPARLRVQINPLRRRNLCLLHDNRRGKKRGGGNHVHVGHSREKRKLFRDLSPFLGIIWNDWHLAGFKKKSSWRPWPMPRYIEIPRGERRKIGLPTLNSRPFFATHLPSPSPGGPRHLPLFLSFFSRRCNAGARKENGKQSGASCLCR